jgi:hypothetical protein
MGINVNVNAWRVSHRLGLGQRRQHDAAISRLGGPDRIGEPGDQRLRRQIPVPE